MRGHTHTHQPAVPVHPHDSTAHRRGQYPTVPTYGGRRRGTLTNYHISPGTTRTLSVAVGGRWARLRCANKLPHGHPVPKRGKVRIFSARSRSRLIQTLCQFATDRLPPGILFETLTYPRHYSPSPAQWHADLDDWANRFVAENPGAFFVWKLEFQKRGAPHFHLLIFGVPWTPKLLEQLQLKWRSWWYEIVGSSDRRHARRGAHLEVVASVAQVVRYTSKYVGKPDESIRADGTGRIWGVRNRAAAPRTILTAEVSDGEFFALRRSFKRLMGARRSLIGQSGPNCGGWAAVSSRAAIRYLEYLTAQSGGRLRVGAYGELIEKQSHGTPGYPWDWLESSSSSWARPAGRYPTS